MNEEYVARSAQLALLLELSAYLKLLSENEDTFCLSLFLVG